MSDSQSSPFPLSLSSQSNSSSDSGGGRKNWLFNDQPDGVSASATFYSLIETAKANGLEPYKYLCYLCCGKIISM